MRLIYRDKVALFLLLGVPLIAFTVLGVAFTLRAMRRGADMRDPQHFPLLERLVGEFARKHC